MNIYKLSVIFFCMCEKIKGFDIKIVDARKDANTCCDKLENSSFSTDCQQTTLWAGEHERYAYTPGFPNEFPIKKLCTWGIYTKPGKRIRLEFRDFYLIGPGDDGLCYSQGVIIKSPLSGLEMGPHCGNAGLPSVVSAGNYLVVELISNIPMTTENYRGFKMSFVETVETPSQQLRPPNWGNDVVMTADPEVVKKLFSVPTVASKRPVVNRGKTSKPPRFKPDRKLDALNPTVYPIPAATRRVLPPNIKLHGPQATQSPAEETKPLALEHIVGIAVGCIVLIGIIFLLIITIRHRRRNEKKRTDSEGKIEGKVKKINEESENKEVINNSSYIPETPNSSSAPGYYVYYYHQNEKHKDNVTENAKSYAATREMDAPQNQKMPSKSRKSAESKKRKHRRLHNLKTISITKARRTQKTSHKLGKEEETSRRKNRSTKHTSARKDERKKTSHRTQTNNNAKHPNSSVNQNGTSSSQEKSGPKEYKLLPPKNTTKVTNGKSSRKSIEQKTTKTDKSAPTVDSKHTNKRRYEQKSRLNTVSNKQLGSGKTSSRKRH